MGQMTRKQARAVDAVLTAVARGYNHLFAPVANLLFPVVPVETRGGFVIEFGVEDFRLINSARAPGTATKRVQFGHAGAPYALVDYSLEALVPVEIGQEAASVGIDQWERSIRGVQRLMDIERENQAAVIARKPANYPAGHKLEITNDADRWDDPTSDPLGDIEDGREAIRAKTGLYPNVLVLPPKAEAALLRHPDVLDKLSDSNLKVATRQLLQTILQIPNIVVGDGTYHDGTKFVDIWGKDAVLAYTEIGTLQDGGSPSYGYTYQLTDMPMVEEPYVDRNAKSAVGPVTDARAPVLASAQAGYLFTGVIK